VGIYLPLSLDVPILIGGLLALAARRRMAGGAGEAGERGLLFASGLIAGEALLGIGLAALVVGGLPLPWVLSDGPLLSLLLFAGVVVLFARVAGALRVHQSSR